MYDMYKWDRAATDDAGTRRFKSDSARPARAKQAPGVRAVQVALDRRDNGGDSGAARDQ